MSTILLAEQSIQKDQRLEMRLSALGYQVISIAESDLLDMVMNHPFDMVLCSGKMLNEEPEEWIQHIRMFSDVPLLKIQEVKHSGCEDRITALFDGVMDPNLDDATLSELLSDHLRAAYRKCHNVRLYQYKGLKLSNGAIKTAEMNQHILDLTVKEYMIMSLLLCHRDCIYTKSSLYEAVWRQPYLGDDNAIKIHISNLRNKLKKANPNETYIETVRGLGYRLCKN